MRTERTMPNRKSLPLVVLGVLLILATVLPLSAALAAFDPYPVKPVRLLIAFAPGGSTDIVGRLIAAKLSERLGKQVIPENRSGGGGTIGAEMVMKAEPDGHTLFFNLLMSPLYLSNIFSIFFIQIGFTTSAFISPFLIKMI